MPVSALNQYSLFALFEKHFTHPGGSAGVTLAACRVDDIEGEFIDAVIDCGELGDSVTNEVGDATPTTVPTLFSPELVEELVEIERLLGSSNLFEELLIGSSWVGFFLGSPKGGTDLDNFGMLATPSLREGSLIPVAPSSSAESELS